MFKKIMLLSLIFAAGALFAQNAGFTAGKDVSFAMGVLIARSLKDSRVVFDFDAFCDGLRKAIDGNSQITEEEALQIVQQAFLAELEREKRENLEKSAQFMAENKKKKGVTTTKSGLEYEIIEKGSGQKPKSDSVVTVHYTGYLTDGSVFDNSRDRQEPVSIPLDGVIPGWSEGIQLMRVGARFKFYIPPDLAYGEDSPSDGIPPNSVLVFDVELIGIEVEE